MKKQKTDLASLLALYQQVSPERETQQQLDSAKLAEVLQSQQYAQTMGYPSLTSMRMGQENEDRDERNALYSDSRKQAELSNALQHAMTSGRMDMVQQLISQAYPEWGAPPPRPERKKH